MKIPKIGMRTIKTVIAVILTLIISDILKLNSPLLASIAAIMAMESSISESITTGKNRMYGTILGGAVGLILSYILPVNYIFITVGFILLITICNILEIDKAVRMAMIVLLSIALNYDEGKARIDYAFFRTLDTLIGVAVGAAINYFIRPPNVEEKIKKIIDNAYSDINNILDKLIWNQEIIEVEGFKKDIIAIGDGYKVFMKDLRFHVGKSNNSLYYKKLFSSFEKINNHLSVIWSIKQHPLVDEKNRITMESYFNKSIPDQNNNEVDNLDLTFNYHLEKILSELIFVDSIIKKTIVA